MKNNFKKHIILLILLFIAVFDNCVIAAGLSEEKKDIETQRVQLKQKIFNLKQLEKLESNKLIKNQQKLENAQHNLQKNQKEYSSAETEMQSLEKKLDVLLKDNRKHLEYTQKRLVQIYKHKRTNYIEFLMSATDVNAFLDRLYFENIIITYDKKKLFETKKCARDILALKSKIENQKNNLETAIANIEREKSDIKIELAKNEKLIEKLRTDRATWEKAERDLAKQSRAISQMINQEIKKTQKEGMSVTVVGGFVKPVNGKISSPFGWRMHPIFKRKIFHSGIDIGVPYGTPIKAANSGRVIFVGWYSGYGKVVIIDHGNINGVPTTTLYAYMSQTLVKQGSTIGRGQVIGKVGTTGYSTGPHLHFEVRQKGNPVNPLNFVR